MKDGGCGCVRHAGKRAGQIRRVRGFPSLTDAANTNVKANRPKHRRIRYFVARGLFDGHERFADLEARIARLPTEKDRGDAFEVFAEAYLTTQKIVEADEVWPADQVPIAVLQTCRLPLKDMGADGAYRTWSGQYNA